MEKTDARYGAYIQILKEELVPAMGCTEPIALAYGAAVARDILGGIPDRVKVQASGSIIKNVHDVIRKPLRHIQAAYKDRLYTAERRLQQCRCQLDQTARKRLQQ